MNSLGLGPVYTDKSSDTAGWLKLFFGLPLLPPNEVPDGFAVDVMSNAPTSDVAVKFADYVFENYMYIDVDSKFPPMGSGLNRRMCLEQYLTHQQWRRGLS